MKFDKKAKYEDEINGKNDTVFGEYKKAKK